MAELRAGHVVWTELDKKRTALVYKVADNGLFAWVAYISSTFDADALTEWETELAWAEDGKCMTGLDRPCVVVANKLDKVQCEDCAKIGYVPSSVFLEVDDKIREYKDSV